MSTINVIALKPFSYSVNGYTEIAVVEHQTFDLPEHLFAGLNDERYVRRTVAGAELATKTEVPIEKPKAVIKGTVEQVNKSPVSNVEIPDDWKTLKFFALRSLASKLGSNVKTMDDAIAAIEAELARRS